MSTKMIDEAFEQRDTIQQLSYNKWCALTLGNIGFAQAPSSLCYTANDGVYGF